MVGCLYFEKECSILGDLNVPKDVSYEAFAAFCNCCIVKRDSDRLMEELKINRMNLIANILAAYPNDEVKAKEVYRMLKKYIDEWEVM